MANAIETENIIEKQEEEFDEKAVLSAFRRFRIIDVFMVRVFFLCLFAVFVIALIPTLRTSYSPSENRQLEKFPEFSFKALCSGDYFDDINLWFSDTFPFREQLITVNGFLKSAYAGQGVQVHGQIENSDDIPEDSASSEENAPVEQETETKPAEEAVASEPEPQKPQPIVEQVAALLLVDDTAYEYYNFNKGVADNYANALNRTAELLPDTNIYNIIVPTAIGIKLQPEIAANVNSSDQKKAIDYMYSLMSDRVNKVNVFDTLYAHRDEYLYFRTDHHWTALGAYYTYSDFMKAKGIEPTPITSFTESQFPGFLGSFYNTTGKNPRLAANPDTVFAYNSPNAPQMTITSIANNQPYSATYPVIRDGNAMGQGSKYLSFLGGDIPFSVITNESIEENSVCTVVKESFGNCFVPFLTENYRTVYVIDYRYFSQVDPRGIQQFVLESGTSDLVFINNISATRNASLINTLNSLVR